MGNFKFTKTDIEGMFVVEPAVYGDNRGYFMETYSKADFEEIGLNYDFVQDNQSKSKKGIKNLLYPFIPKFLLRLYRKIKYGRNIN